MLLKLQEEKHLKRNAQRREAYLREKIKLPEDLVLFWEEQEKALGAKDISGTQSRFYTMKITYI